MKASLEPSGTSWLLTLSPESDDDRLALMTAGSEMSPRPYMINCRGFRYLEPEVQFLIQPMPRGD